MKRYGRLFERIVSKENIELAYAKAKKRKTWQDSVKEVEQDKERKHICYTSSALLRKQLEAAADELPFIATIVEKNHWLTLT